MREREHVVYEQKSAAETKKASAESRVFAAKEWKTDAKTLKIETEAELVRIECVKTLLLARLKLGEKGATEAEIDAALPIPTD